MVYGDIVASRYISFDFPLLRGVDSQYIYIRGQGKPKKIYRRGFGKIFNRGSGYILWTLGWARIYFLRNFRKCFRIEIYLNAVWAFRGVWAQKYIEFAKSVFLSIYIFPNSDEKKYLTKCHFICYNFSVGQLRGYR